MHHHRRQQRHGAGGGGVSDRMPPSLPLVVSLNCLEDTSLEEEGLAGVAAVEHVGLGRISEGRIEDAAAVLIQSLAFLPRAAQRRLQPWQLVLCLGSADRGVDTALAADLGLQLVHVDANRAEEVADTVMALFLGLLRRTHLLSLHVSSSAAASGWLGSIQPLCRGMRRCRGLVLGIVGRSTSARCLATRSLAFRMSVLYFDVQEGNGKSGRSSITFPPAARRMDTLNDLLAASDLVSLHCALTNETIHIINAQCLQHIKPGAFIVNTGSSQLIDDCALKQLLIDGTVAGCALDGVEGPQWMEAWVREMPNVLILPRSADYSEEVWMEIREKAISILHSFFNDEVIPKDAVSDEEDEKSEINEDDSTRQAKNSSFQVCDGEQQTDESQLHPDHSQKQSIQHLKDSHAQSQHSDPILESTSVKPLSVSSGLTKKSVDLLKEGYVIALHTKDQSGFHVSRQRVPGGGWFLDVMTNVTKRDPAAQFLITFRSQDMVGLRSFAAGGKLLQINRRMEFVFASHSFDVWESWILEGPLLEDCKLVNHKNPQAVLDVCVEIVAAVDEDGVTRWLD